MSINSVSLALSAAMALGLASIGGGANAQSDDVVSVKVKYADLNLASEAGARAMLHRIRRAAQEICGPDSYNPIDYRYEYLPCVARVSNEAVGKFGSPMVIALNGGKDAIGAVLLASNR